MPEAAAAALDEDHNRKKCEIIVTWCGRSVRIYSALMAIVIGATLLLLRSDAPICFWCVASTTISAVLLVLITTYHRVRMASIEKGEKKYIAGYEAAKKNIEDTLKNYNSRLDDVDR